MKPSDKDPDKLRLQVFLSHNGICSRREAMNVVKDGRVSLNGQICREPSTPVDPAKDRVLVDGREVGLKAFTYVLMNKPAGATTTKEDRHAKRTVLDILPPDLRHVSPVGRLDRETEGLLLLTNDGDVAYKLTHPKFDIEKTYFARVTGKLDESKKARLEKGVMVEGKKTAPARISHVRDVQGQTELLITIHEGRKRQVRIMFAKVGQKVVYLKRVAQGPLTLGDLKPGQWRMLSRQEIESIGKL